jgi:hypothetical protein
MKTLGCLTMIVLICVGIYFLMNLQGMDDAQKGQWLGDKAHRGWNRIQKMADNAKQGWDKSKPAPTPAP